MKSRGDMSIAPECVPNSQLMSPRPGSRVDSERGGAVTATAPGDPELHLPRLSQIERQEIEYRLGLLGGNKTEVAKSLGISLKTLYNRLNEYKAADAKAGRVHVGS